MVPTLTPSSLVPSGNYYVHVLNIIISCVCAMFLKLLLSTFDHLEYLYDSTGEGRLSDRDHRDIYYKLELQASRWRDIGSALGFLEGELENIQRNLFLLMDSPKSWLREMLTQWLQWAPGDGRGSTGFATRSSLHAALLKVNLGQLAQQFQ